MLRYFPNILSALAGCSPHRLPRGSSCGDDDTAALAVFAFAGLSDAADGFIAKRWGFTSRFGSWLDPAADKLLMILCFLALYQVGAAPLWLVALVICRDCLRSPRACCSPSLFSLPVRIEPLAIGKATTVVQVGTIGLWLLLLALDLEAPGLTTAAAWTAAIFTVLSALAYGQLLLRALVYGRRTR